MILIAMFQKPSGTENIKLWHLKQVPSLRFFT